MSNWILLICPLLFYPLLICPLPICALYVNFEKMKIADKLFLLLFTVIIIFTAFWIFHTHTILQNSDSPITVVRLFDLNNDLLYNIVTIFSIILLLLSNIFYWRTGNAIYFLWSVFYFIAGILSLAILEDARFYYTRHNGLWNGKFSSGFIVSIYLIIILIVITLIDFFIINYLRKKSITKRKKYERLFSNQPSNLSKN